MGFNVLMPKKKKRKVEPDSSGRLVGFQLMDLSMTLVHLWFCNQAWTTSVKGLVSMMNPSTGNQTLALLLFVKFRPLLNPRADDFLGCICERSEEPPRPRPLRNQVVGFKDALQALIGSNRNSSWITQCHCAWRGHGGTEGRVFLMWDACAAGTCGIRCVFVMQGEKKT